MLNLMLYKTKIWQISFLFKNLIYWLLNFLTCLDVPDLSQCLNDILQVKYDSTLAVKCYVPSNLKRDIKCDLLDGNNVALCSEGKYVYHFKLIITNTNIKRWISFTFSMCIYMSLFNILEKTLSYPMQSNVP